MHLRPQDLLLTLQIWRQGNREWSFASLSESLQLSLGEAHGGVQRASNAGLLYETKNGLRAAIPRVLQFILHGVPVTFFAKRGGITRGLPTGVHMPTWLEQIKPQERDMVTVWPHPEGTSRGESIEPLYPTVPEVSKKDTGFYEIVSLIEVMRIGHPIEKKAAASILENKIFKDK